MRKPLIAGNWKMFGRRADLTELPALQDQIGGATNRIDVLICPPYPFIQNAVWTARDTSILIGAQDCSVVAADAARTGEVSAGMLADVGAKYVIVGHSERRTNHGEADETVRQKAEAAVAAGLTPIVCVGETQAERAQGRALEIVEGQVRASVPETGAFVVAYEPVWAIGASVTPTLAEIAEVHEMVRQTLRSRFGDQADGTRILYGGSVNPKNAAEIFAVAGVDGALVGRASLKAADFGTLIQGHPAAI